MRSDKKGFTLIEVLVVLVVLAILSGIAIAKFVSTKESAYVASMKADLRNFALYEQNYLMDSQGMYFSGNGAGQGFVPTGRRHGCRHDRSWTAAQLARPRQPQQDCQDVLDHDLRRVHLGNQLSLRAGS